MKNRAGRVATPRPAPCRLRPSSQRPQTSPGNTPGRTLTDHSESRRRVRTWRRRQSHRRGRDDHGRLLCCQRGRPPDLHSGMYSGDWKGRRKTSRRRPQRCGLLGFIQIVASGIRTRISMELRSERPPNWTITTTPSTYRQRADDLPDVSVWAARFRGSIYGSQYTPPDASSRTVSPAHFSTHESHGQTRARWSKPESTR